MTLTKLKAVTAFVLTARVAFAAAGPAAHEAFTTKSVQAKLEDEPEHAGKNAEQPKAATPRSIRTDQYGDPLPEGAIARMGSIQWRHLGLECFVFLDGGRTALTAGTDRTLRTWKVETGKLLRSAELQGSPGWPLAISPDGKTLVGQNSGKLVFWATETGKEIKRIVTGKAGVGHLQFSPDNRILAGETGNGRVSLWDWQKGRELALPGPTQESLDSTFHICFSQDSKWIAVGVWWMKPLRIYETATGREIHQLDCRAMFSTFSPDGKRLAICSQLMKPSIEIRLIDSTSGKELASFPLNTDGFFQSLAFSPDGKMLACGGYSESCLIDLTKGEVRHRLPGSVQLAFAPDGKVVAGNFASRLRFFDTGTGKEIYDRPSSFGGQDTIEQIAVSPNGQRLASASQRECAVYLWDTANGKLIQRLALSGEKCSSLDGLAFAPDGQTLLIGRRNGQVEFWDSIRAKELRTISLHDPVPLDEDKGFGYHLLHASADGKHFCTVEQCSGREFYLCKRLAVWESSTGKLVRDYSIPADKWVCSWPPDGSALALPTDDGMELRDVDSGRVRFRLKGALKGGIVAASPDQRLIAVLGTKEMGRGPLGWTIKEGPVRLWEAATGKEVASIPAAPAAHLALAGGGRCLVTTDQDFLRVWDLASGKERRGWPLPSGAMDASRMGIVSHLFTLPDGRRAVTTLFDGTALVWDLSAAVDSLEPLTKNLMDNNIAHWWKDLAGDDTPRAYAAVWRLAEAGPSAVAFLSERLRPAPEPDTQQISRHIRNLDNDSFEVREKALKDLEALGNAAVPALRAVLHSNPSPEARRRVERLLEERPSARLAPEALRSLRALHVLELIGSDDTRGPIAKVAGGAGYALETQEAKAVMKRLDWRPMEK